MNHFPFILTAILLVGCASSPPKAEPPTVNSGKAVLIDRKFFEECSVPPKLSSGEESVVVGWAIDLLAMYEDCSNRNSSHIKLLKQNFPEAQQ